MHYWMFSICLNNNALKLTPKINKARWLKLTIWPRQCQSYFCVWNLAKSLLRLNLQSFSANPTNIRLWEDNSKTSLRRLEGVFSVTISRLPRRLQDGKLLRFIMTKTENRSVISLGLGCVLHHCNAEKRFIYSHEYLSIYVSIVYTYRNTSIN